MKKTIVLSVLATLAILLLAGLGVIHLGAYDVAATAEHSSVTRWALNTLQHSSVARRAGDAPVALPTDSASLAHGFEHYEEMCVVCHGAPGIDRGEFGQGMAPTPPDLAEEVHEWSDAQLFWITKNGIKLAGMPGFGPTHSDEEIRAIVAFLRRLEEMTPEEYAALAEAHATSGDSVSGDGHDHTH